ncbi:MAG: type II toxin-antitoxin system VapC family toxin [Pseudomonadota bacterium]
MKRLFDTHLILWAAFEPDKLPQKAKAHLADTEQPPWFSVANLWEVSIKASLGREDFTVSASILRTGLLDHGWRELNITGDHIMALSLLPGLHRDPFDRILIAQAFASGSTLITHDRAVSAYDGPIEYV